MAARVAHADERSEVGGADGYNDDAPKGGPVAAEPASTDNARLNSTRVMNE